MGETLKISEMKNIVNMTKEEYEATQLLESIGWEFILNGYIEDSPPGYSEGRYKIILARNDKRQNGK